MSKKPEAPWPHATHHLRLPEPPTELERLRQLTYGFDLFADEHGTAWAAIPEPDGESRELLAIRSRQFRLWFIDSFRRDGRDPPRDGNLRDVIRYCEARALSPSSRRFPVFRRFVAFGMDSGLDIPDPSSVVLDLANGDGDLLSIDAEHAYVNPNGSVFFERTPGQQALPAPVIPKAPEALLTSLRRLVRPLTSRGFDRILAWLLSALHPGGPYPVLVLHGSTPDRRTRIARLLRDVIDPVSQPFNRFPTTEPQLHRAARESHILLFNEMTALTPKRAATLCRLATEFRRPVIITLHTDPAAGRPPVPDTSLATLCLPVELDGSGSPPESCTPAVSRTPVESDSPTESGSPVESDQPPAAVETDPPPAPETIAKPDRAKPDRAKPDRAELLQLLLGLLAVAVRGALRHYTKTATPPGPLSETPLSAAHRWTLAAAAEFCLTPQQIEAVFAEPARIPTLDPEGARALSDLTAALRRLLNESPTWSGTAEQLRAELPKRVRAGDARALSVALRKILPALEEAGIEVEFATPHGQRTITISRTIERNAKPFEAPRTSVPPPPKPTENTTSYAPSPHNVTKPENLRSDPAPATQSPPPTGPEPPHFPPSSSAPDQRSDPP